MRRVIEVLMSAILLITITSCASKESAWQEQYDMGMRFMADGDYEQAIIAFTAAIEVDPNNAMSYIGRGDAYLLNEETDDSLNGAQADYEKALELDDTIAEAYLGLADVYIRRGDFDKALSILQQGMEKASDTSKISEKIEEVKSGNISDSAGRTRKSVHIENGELKQYWLYDYDEHGDNVKTDCYTGDGIWDNTETKVFNDKHQEISSIRVSANDETRFSYEYNIDGRKSREIETRVHKSEGNESTTIQITEISYDDVKRTETHDTYNEDGTLNNSFVIEYDENNVRTKASSYNINGNRELYLDYYVIYIWNEDGSYGGYELFQVAPHDDVSN